MYMRLVENLRLIYTYTLFSFNYTQLTPLSYRKWLIGSSLFEDLPSSGELRCSFPGRFIGSCSIKSFHRTTHQQSRTGCNACSILTQSTSALSRTLHIPFRSFPLQLPAPNVCTPTLKETLPDHVIMALRRILEEAPLSLWGSLAGDFRNANKHTSRTSHMMTPDCLMLATKIINSNTLPATL